MVQFFLSPGLHKQVLFHFVEYPVHLHFGIVFGNTHDLSNFPERAALHKPEFNELKLGRLELFKRSGKSFLQVILRIVFKHFFVKVFRGCFLQHHHANALLFAEEFIAFVRCNAIQPGGKGQATEVETWEVQQGLEKDLGSEVGRGGLVAYPAQNKKEDSSVVLLVQNPEILRILAALTDNFLFVR